MKPIPKLPKHYSSPWTTKWSGWVYPRPDSYFFRCSDCGLVHEMQFKAFVETDKRQDAFQVVPLPTPIRTMFRVRRRTK